MNRELLTKYIALRRAHREDTEILWKYFDENRYLTMLYEAYDTIQDMLGITQDEDEAIIWRFIGTPDERFKTDEELIDWICANHSK